jgi:hypothetical protein
VRGKMQKDLRPIHPGNFQCFLNVYKEKLIESIKNNPDEYSWSLNELETVFQRMSRAIEKGSFNKDSSAIKATCKELKIKHTYTAIRDFITL